MPMGRARDLRSAELRVRWGTPGVLAIAESGPGRYPDPNSSSLPFSRQRYGACELAHAFNETLHSRCLRQHDGASWAALLKGERVAFIGDSILRDLLFSLAALLSTALPLHNFTAPHRLYGDKHWGRLHAGTNRPSPPGHESFLSASFAAVADEPQTQLVWCWFSDTRCIQRREVQTSALVIAGFGAHLFRHYERGSFHAHIGSAWANELRRLERQATQASKGTPQLVWLEYPTAHFPWGRALPPEAACRQRPLLNLGPSCIPFATPLHSRACC